VGNPTIVDLPASAGSWATFSDPDGNSWFLQEITDRLPGRVTTQPTYASAGDLAAALRRAAAAHGKHEERTGEADPNWPDWYAHWMVREQTRCPDDGRRDPIVGTISLTVFSGIVAW